METIERLKQILSTGITRNYPIAKLFKEEKAFKAQIKIELYHKVLEWIDQIERKEI